MMFNFKHGSQYRVIGACIFYQKTKLNMTTACLCNIHVAIFTAVKLDNSVGLFFTPNTRIVGTR